MTDLTIRGAGIFGLSIAWICTRRGARVRLVDPFGAGSGSSGGLVGALAPHVPENWNPKKAFQFDSLIRAEQFWAEVEAVGGRSSGYGRTGRLQPIVDDTALARARDRAETARALWGDHASWSVVPADPAQVWTPPSASGYLIHDTLTARAHPRHAGAALIAALAQHGVYVEPEAPDAGRVVWATGAAGLRDLSQHIGKTVGVGIKGQSALLDYDAGPDAPQIFADALHIIPHADGTVAIGSTTERDYDAPNTTDTQLDDIVARARLLMPCLTDAPVIDRWAGERPRSRSRAPMLGPWPGRHDHFIANGGFKIGFGMAPQVAEVMADLLLDDVDRIPDDFRVEASL